MKRTGNSFALGVAVIVLTLGSPAVLASGDHEGGHGNSDNGHGHDDGHGRMDFDFGMAAPADEADRTVEIVARDTMRFEPAHITVEAGETVTFRVRNVGQLQHSFTLGSHGYHQQHDREMMDMPMDDLAHHMDDSPNGMVVQPGETGTLTWRFRKGGAIEFACHIPGHYPAGMKGRLEIE
jgi:uncharacterized cupredoxin-like copper-binding protein